VEPETSNATEGDEFHPTPARDPRAIASSLQNGATYGCPASSSGPCGQVGRRSAVVAGGAQANGRVPCNGRRLAERTASKGHHSPSSCRPGRRRRRAEPTERITILKGTITRRFHLAIAASRSSRCETAIRRSTLPLLGR
jgi:hypothetical protein